jgi:hypothetical protein
MLRRLRCLRRSKSASSSSSHLHFPPAWLYSRLTFLLRLFIQSKYCIPVLTSRSFYVYQITLDFLDSDHDHAQCRAPGAPIQRLILLLLACFTHHTYRTFLVLRDILRMITLFTSHMLYLHASFSYLAFARLLHILTSIFRAPRDTRTTFDLGQYEGQQLTLTYTTKKLNIESTPPTDQDRISRPNNGGASVVEDDDVRSQLVRRWVANPGNRMGSALSWAWRKEEGTEG